MAETFDSKKLADKSLAEKNESINKCQTLGERFCPMINGPCVTNCVCFNPPFIGCNMSYEMKRLPTEWYVYDHSCGNEMFYKEEYNVNSRTC